MFFHMPFQGESCAERDLASIESTTEILCAFSSSTSCVGPSNFDILSFGDDFGAIDHNGRIPFGGNWYAIHRLTVRW